MPTVDDLVVSVRIDETSNLGKLQKQLTALVGKDGKKAINLAGFGGVGSSDLNFIKNKLMELSPITLGRENKQVRETVKTTIRQLQRKQIQDMLVAKYSKLTKEEIKSWVSFMAQELEAGGGNIGSLSGLVREIHMAIFGAEGKGGPQQTTLTNIRKKLPERYMQRTLEKVMKDMGEWFEGQYQVYEIDKEKVIKYRDELDQAITDKSKEIKNLEEGSVNITKDMEEALFELSQKTRDSDVFVETAVKDILKMGTDSVAIIQKLRMGMTDPILELLALIRTRATDKYGVTLIENLKNLLPKFKQSLMEPGPSRVDIKITKSLVEKILDNVEEIGLKVHDFGGAIDALKNQPEELISELKNVWTKSNVKSDFKHDKRLKETGKDFVVLMGISSTAQALKELKKEQESSALNAKYLFLEFLPKTLEDILATPENIDELLDKTGVYDNVDRVFTGMEEIKGNIKSLIEQTIDKDPDNLKRLMNELFGLDEHITEIAEKEDAIMDAVKSSKQSLIQQNNPQQEEGDEKDT